MTECKNCGHELANCGIHPHKKIVCFGELVGCGYEITKDEYCGCIKPQPKEAKKKNG